MNSCVPDYLIQGNGTVYTIDSCYKNGGRQAGPAEGRAAREECADGPTKEKERKIKRRKGKGFFLVLTIAL
jgi:hypothetical protein